MTGPGAVAPLPNGVWRALRHFVEPHAVATFFVPGDPVPKKRRIGEGRRAFTPKVTVEGEKAVRDAFRQVLPGWEAEPDATYGVLIEFRTRSGSKVDVDNGTKLIYDALNKVFWQDDIQVGDSYQRLVRTGVDPGTEVILFQVEDNGTPKTKVCDCGKRYRALARMCANCTRMRATVNQLLQLTPEEHGAELARQKRDAFSFLLRYQTGSNATPATADFAAHLAVTETRARTVINALIGDGCVARQGRSGLRIVGSLKGAAS